MDVEELKVASIRHFGREKLAAVFGNFNLAVDGSPDDDPTGFGTVVTIVAVTVEEFIDEVLEMVGVRDFLKENDVGFESADCVRGIGATGTIEGDDPENFAAGMVLGWALYERLDAEATQRAGFIGNNKNREGPDEDGEERKTGAVNNEGEDSQDQSD
ncbi:MAG: hypothetical protein ACJAT3_001798 [Akkermansiaceae bacterium]